jgi:hypothetical protein
MATRQTKSSQAKSGKRSSSRSGGDSNGHVGAAQVARHAREQMRDLTGQPVEGVLAVKRGEDDGWIVTVQVLELQRIPSSTDVLGAYELSLDDRGEVREYQRTRRYYRNQVEEG